jgi:hypothetical protein
MESRLDLLSPKLVKELSQADEEKLRRIAATVCEIALLHTELENPFINYFKESMDGLPSVDRLFLQQELERFVDQLDEIQWTLKEQVDLGTETMPNYLKAFRNARIFNALYYALDADPYIAAAESIYETFAATNDLKTLEEAIIKTVQSG